MKYVKLRVWEYLHSVLSDILNFDMRQLGYYVRIVVIWSLYFIEKLSFAGLDADNTISKGLLCDDESSIGIYFKHWEGEIDRFPWQTLESSEVAARNVRAALNKMACHESMCELA